MPIKRRLAATAAVVSVVLIATAGASTGTPESDDGSGGRTAEQTAGKPVTVMTRNVFLGADLGPGLAAKNLDELIDGAGTILNQVDANRPGKRLRGVADEILTHKPDLVGLQEAALWRTRKCAADVFPPKATKVRYDFVKRLIRHLGEGGETYEVANLKRQFDFESPANTSGNAEQNHCDINGRLTMRDVVLVRRTEGARKIQIRNKQAGTFKNLLKVKPAGIRIPVTRGWLSVDAKVGKAPWLHFVNSHFEAFDNERAKPSIRAKQAREMVAAKGPVKSSKLPTVLLGDFNSDIRTEVKPGDEQAFRVLVKNGLHERATWKPLGCCLGLDLLGPGADPADAAGFDHKVDHIMTNRPNKVTLQDSAVTGRTPFRGWWASDHAGIVSRLTINN